MAELVDALDLGSSELACAGSSPVPGNFFQMAMIDELTCRLISIGLNEEMAAKTIETIADFAKTKLPLQFHSAMDDMLAGKSSDLGPVAGLLDRFKGLFGEK